MQAELVTDYDQVLTTLMAQFYPAGMLGVGLTGLMASFMSGMAGNVTAFNTVFTYDIYQSYIRKDAPDSHYLTVGRMTTVVGVLLSIGAAYVARRYNNIMDLLQLVFGFVNAPLFAHVPAGHVLEADHGERRIFRTDQRHRRGIRHLRAYGGGRQRRLDLRNLYTFPSTMAQNFWIAIMAFGTCFVITIAGQHGDHAAYRSGHGRTGLRPDEDTA